MARSSELLARALRHHKAGNLSEAEKIYGQILAADPTHVDALHHLGVIATQLGKHESAIEYIRQAIAQIAGVAAFHYNLGCAYQAGNKRDEAIAAYQEAVRLKPKYIEAHHNLGVALQESGKVDQAADCFRHVLQLNPKHALAHLQLGKVLARQNSLDEAIASFQKAAKLKPDLIDALVDLGAALRRLGKLSDAKNCFEAALRQNPALASAHNQLGRIAEAEGRLDQARRRFESALKHDPGLAAAHLNLGRVATRQRKYDEAEQRLRIAVQHDPASAAAHEALGAVLAGQGCWAESLQMLALAYQLEPSDARRLKHATVLPIVSESIEQMHEHRRRLHAGLAQLLAGNPHIADPLGLGMLDFYIAYHGMNKRSWRADLAKLYLKACPGLDYVAPHCRSARPRATGRKKIKIGFLSQHLRTHTIGRLNVGLIEQLDRSKFEVFVIRQTAHDDELARRINKAADHSLTMPDSESLSSARETIAALELDVAYYPDIGMEPWTYLLAFSRLAPVQCLTWGHPLTSGIPALDYFVSSEDLDSPAAGDHYSERLVRLPRPAVYYHRPTLKHPAKTRSHFALPEGAHLYGCLQTLYKFHPEFDSILAEILRRDPAGIAVLISGTRSRWNELLLKRFRTSMSDVVERVRLVPPQAYPDFLALASLCDVMLDPLHFGGGNTAYEALSFGVPVVTLPSEFLRGRIAQALYCVMNLSDCVVKTPEEYVSLAVRLGTHAEYRATISQKIIAVTSVLFENDAGVRQLEDFLAQAVEQNYSG